MIATAKGFDPIPTGSTTGRARIRHLESRTLQGVPAAEDAVQAPAAQGFIHRDRVDNVRRQLSNIIGQIIGDGMRGLFGDVNAPRPGAFFPVGF